VYIIRHKHSNNSYIGSTTDFDKRKSHHKDAYNKEKTYKLYQFIRENGGWDNFDMVKICDCEEDERLKMEQYHMDFVKPTLNCKRVIGWDIERNKEKNKEWIKNNPDKVKKHAKDSYYRNHEKRKEMGKEYRNRTEVKERQKEYLIDYRSNEEHKKIHNGGMV